MSGLRVKTRQLFNDAKRTEHWDSQKEAITYYSKEISKAKRSSWRRYCQVTANVQGSDRLMEFMAKQANNRVSITKLSYG
jgi:hypothetical protein